MIKKCKQIISSNILDSVFILSLVGAWLPTITSIILMIYSKKQLNDATQQPLHEIYKKIFSTAKVALTIAASIWGLWLWLIGITKLCLYGQTSAPPAQLTRALTLIGDTIGFLMTYNPASIFLFVMMAIQFYHFRKNRS